MSRQGPQPVVPRRADPSVAPLWEVSPCTKRAKPLTRTLAFDVLALDGPVIDRPYAKRRAFARTARAAWLGVLRGSPVARESARADTDVLIGI